MAIEAEQKQNDTPEDKPLIRLFNKDIIEESESQDNKEICLAASERIRELMKADNFSLLIGAGSSIDLGGVSFGKNRLAFSGEGNGWVAEIFASELKDDYVFLLQRYIQYRKDSKLNERYGVEDFITYLFKLEYAQKSGFAIKKGETEIDITKIKEKILDTLILNCSKINYKDRTKIQPYKTFLKRIISRPTSLRRTNLFTTNYDLVFESLMDEMGLIYVDGFVGGLKHYFNPQAFNYDYYYPGGTTEGRVSRMEKVLHYYKLHGSLNWIESEDDSFMNIYGIEKTHSENLKGTRLIYPTPMKEQDTIGFPYAELFRRFANAIQQPQCVLITYGYSFGDSHINRIIYEALSIPSFQLVIVSHQWTENIKELSDRFKDQASIGFIIGKDFANWQAFATKIIPDLPSVELEDKYEEKRMNAQMLKRFIDKGAEKKADGK